MPRMIGRGLSRREREILEVLHRKGRASVTEVLEELPDPPSYSSVRSILSILERKGHVQHHEEGKRYLYAPTEPAHTAARTALVQVVQTFFGGSLERAVKTFLSDQETAITNEELQRLVAMIEEAQREGEV